MNNRIRQFISTAAMCLALTALPASAAEPAEKIDINTATAEQLSELKGVGKSKANAIVAYRKEHGKFTDLNELKDVKGIGDSILESNRPLLTLE